MLEGGENSGERTKEEAFFSRNQKCPKLMTWMVAQSHDLCKKRTLAMDKCMKENYIPKSCQRKKLLTAPPPLFLLFGVMEEQLQLHTPPDASGCEGNFASIPNRFFQGNQDNAASSGVWWTGVRTRV